eukprot:6509184-Ditylum_brightwellii.AAC.1
MSRFGGRSFETHQIKNKHIGEGYKFFLCTTLQGLVANFTPDERTASKSGRQESSVNSSDGKIEPMILFITSVIDNFCEKQNKKLDRTATRATDKKREAGVEMNKFYMAIDNYFTLVHDIKMLREKRICVVGMARMRKG